MFASIGGGYTGLSAALHLAAKGYQTVLLEANRVGWGASGRNGGQVNVGQRRPQDELERSLGDFHARQLWDLGLEAVRLVHRLIDQHDIDCGFTWGVIHADHRKRLVRHSFDYAELLRGKYDYEQIEALDQSQIRERVGSPSYFGGIIDYGGGHLHPLAYALGLARAAAADGVQIFENTRVLGVEFGQSVRITTAQATINARYAVIGCNGYHGDLFEKLAAQVMPINNFIVASEPLSEVAARDLIRDNEAVADSRFVINYFHLSQDRRLLFGGGESYGHRFPKDIVAKVRRPMLQVFPQMADKKIDYAWGGTLGITVKRLPCVMRVADNILSAGGFSGHGVAPATLAGSILADAIDGQAAKFDVFSKIPLPSFPGGPSLRTPLLALAMTWFALRDRL